ncbi:Prephenate dehydrogenase [Epithele typhae]|uniref:Prephenate dehydrogenase n=1 Tax=Epithele typhae TaxID=378194 RepID=UPI0020085102|nr:Prephenate dehydrogenase [Epithele typhae]KAH9931708.1 Prephenate dehydrogenase [Epithele typhae]
MTTIRPDVTPDSPVDEQPAIGLIGVGAMGSMYARRLSEAGWKKIYICDLPAKYEALQAKFADVPGVHVLKDGHLVSRVSDFIMYSVEAEFIDRVVAEYGPSTKVGAIVSGQISVKAPEKEAFEKYLPQDVHIVSCHSLHGPTVSTVGQPLILIKHRASDDHLKLVEGIFACLKSRYVYLSYEDHDVVTANTQAVTHAAFLSMGTAWHSSSSYPWEHGLYVGGIETVKVNIMLRIYSNQWHVYAGLAILNPSARTQIDQYARSTTDIFKLMPRTGPDGRASPAGGAPPNSHLSLLAMVDCWAALGTRPLEHLELAATPLFRLWIGVAAHLFRSRARLDAALAAALHNTTHRADDLEFVVAARGWSQCISFGSFALYRQRFGHTAAFFESRFEEATKVGSAMIQAIMEQDLLSTSAAAGTN